MGLTRPKYSQIYDTDYKQSCRVATTTSITLTGGAPTVVDGKTLVQGNRVLVKSQATGAQNGIYVVLSLGTGSNGTWIRALDADTASKLTPGATVVVEEGTANASKVFRMSTPSPITIGVTGIVWTDVTGTGTTPGGIEGQVQFNLANAFTGAEYLHYNSTTGAVVANSGLASSSTTTGALVVTGGAGISGNATIGNRLTVGSATVLSSTLDVTGASTIGGSIGVTGASTLSSTLDVGGVTKVSGNLVALATTSSTNTTTGALVVKGGAGIAGEVYIGANVTVTGHIIPSANVTYSLGDTTHRFKDLYLSGSTIDLNGATIKSTSGSITFTNPLGASFSVTGSGSGQSTASFGNLIANSGIESSSTTTGAVIVQGGMGVTGNVNIGGTLTVANLQARGSMNIVAQDPMLYLQANVLAPWNFDTGIYSDSYTSGTVSNIYVHHGMVRNYTNGVWGFFSNLVSEPDATINWSDAGIIYDKIKAGEVIIANTTAATSTTSGALQVAGGIGIAGDTHIGGATYISGTTTITGVTKVNSNVVAASGTSSSSTTTGALVVIGGTGISGAAYIGGLIDVTGASTLRSTLGVTGATTLSSTLAVTGDTTYSSNTQATSTSTGSMKIKGGMSIQTGNLYIGGSAGTAITHTGHIIPSANLAFNIGSSTAWYGTFYGVSTQAKYADLAENYTSDADYISGIVVVFGGEQEITISTKDHDPAVAGVISTNPAYLMNAECKGLPVAFTGRVPCFVQGPVKKGDVLVTSNEPGVAQAIDNSKFVPGCIIGKALETISTNSIETIEIVVGRD
jgi:hypothetical protein